MAASTPLILLVALGVLCTTLGLAWPTARGRVGVRAAAWLLRRSGLASLAGHVLAFLAVARHRDGGEPPRDGDG